MQSYLTKLGIILTQHILLAAAAVWLSAQLGYDGYGIIAYTLSLGILSSIVFNLGCDQLLIKAELAEIRARLDFAAATSIGIGGLSIAAGAALGTALTSAFTLGAALSLSTISAAAMQGHGWYNRAMVLKLLLPYASFLLLAYIASRLGMDPVAWPAAGTLLLAAIFLLITRRSFVATANPPDVGALLPSMLRDGFYILLFSSTLVLIQQIDIAMVAWFLDPEAVGQYALAVRLVGLGFMGHIAAAAVLPRQMARYFRGQEACAPLRREIAGWIVFSASIWGIVAAGLAIVLPWLAPEMAVNCAFGLTLMLLMIGVGVNVLTGLCGFALNMGGHQKRAAVIGFAAVAVNIVLNVLLLPVMGITGAAVATLVSVSAMNLALAVEAVRHSGLHTSLLVLVLRE